MLLNLTKERRFNESKEENSKESKKQTIQTDSPPTTVTGREKRQPNSPSAKQLKTCPLMSGDIPDSSCSVKSFATPNSFYLAKIKTIY